MYRAFSEQGHYRWLTLLPELINKYNNSMHRTITMKPSQVNETNERKVLQRIKRNTTPHIKVKNNKLKVGNRVRISKHKITFAKGYTPNWTNEIYTVHRVQPTIPVTYLLKDHTGEVLDGGFYDQELSKTSVGDVYLVEKYCKVKVIACACAVSALTINTIRGYAKQI